jgi:hypothetical protein
MSRLARTATASGAIGRGAISTSLHGQRTAFLAIAYAVLGAGLVASRVASLGHGFWLDEAVFVQNYVREGPREILTGNGLSHELYGVLVWTISSVVGESEIAFRLCSAVPFVIGVGLVTSWLHHRVHAVAGLFYLLLATTSPLLLDITRSARGYGLAFCAMSFLVVAALEAGKTGRSRYVALACVAGVVGTWTLPQFGLAFVGVGASLLADHRVRQSALVGLATSLGAILVWYAPHFGQVEASSQIPQGIKIAPEWLLTAPFDQVLLPALIWIDGVVAVPGLIWLPLIAVVVTIIGSSPLLRERGSALVLCAPVAVTVGSLFFARAYVLPRYMSFLLVPLFVLLGSGASSLLSRKKPGPPIVRGAACLVVVALLVGRFVAIAPDVVGLPREANREAAAIVESRTPVTTEIYASIRDPLRLDFYLDRPFHVLRASEVAARVCGSTHPLVYVAEPWAMPRVPAPCLRRDGVKHYRFEQYTRGGEMNVWFVPPKS